MSGPVSRRRRLLRAIAWSCAALFVAFGGAGLAVSADHQPGDATRPERTWQADRAFQARMASTADEFTALGGEVGNLGDTARNALVDLVARNQKGLTTDLAGGDRLVGEIQAHVRALSATFDAIGREFPADTLGERSSSMLIAARDALATTAPLASEWKTLADGSVPAMQLVTVLDQHDAYTFEATQQASARRWAQALALLKKSAATLDTARATRDRFANVADVSTLTTWIDRVAAYDTALAALYTEVRASGGAVTTARAKKLAAQVSKAQAALPPDNRGLVVIMGDLARGGLNQAAISIEQARGDLAQAVAALH